jgi:hypothetical protein
VHIPPPIPHIEDTYLSNKSLTLSFCYLSGAIVGGVVGGIGGLLAIAALLFWLLRRRRRNEFDGDFDPDRVRRQSGTDGLDLAEDAGAAAAITPYPAPAPLHAPQPQPGFPHAEPYMQGGPVSTYAPSAYTSTTGGGRASPGFAGMGSGMGPGLLPVGAGAGGAAAYAYNQQMQQGQHGQSAYQGAYGPHSPIHPGQTPSPPLTNTSGPLQNPYSDSSSSAYGPSIAHASATGGGAGYVGGYAASSSSSPSNPRSNKAREAERLRVANEDGETPDEPVVQHKDGGRVKNEVPPSYDSIPQDS